MIHVPLFAALFGAWNPDALAMMAALHLYAVAALHAGRA